jgi:hypothetical protein
VAGKAVKFGVLGGVLTLVLGYSGIGYFTGAVPFPIEPRGDITADSLCSFMGSRDDRERIAEELRNALPTSREYTSSGNNIRDADGRWQRDSCEVNGDGDQLFYTDAEVGLGDAAGAARGWRDRLLRGYDGEDGKMERFRAGSAAVMTQRHALILVPCTPSPRPSSIEVEVYLDQLLVGSAEENRHALATVALGAARSAHERADCPLPSRLPTKVTGLG